MDTQYLRASSPPSACVACSHASAPWLLALALAASGRRSCTKSWLPALGRGLSSLPRVNPALSTLSLGCTAGAITTRTYPLLHSMYLASIPLTTPSLLSRLAARGPECAPGHPCFLYASVLAWMPSAARAFWYAAIALSRERTAGSMSFTTAASPPRIELGFSLRFLPVRS